MPTSSNSSMQCYCNIEVFHTLPHIRTRMHVKFQHNLVLTLILQNMMKYKVMVVSKNVFSNIYLGQTRSGIEIESDKLNMYLKASLSEGG